MATQKHMGFYRERGTYNGVRYDLHAKQRKSCAKRCSGNLRRLTVA